MSERLPRHTETFIVRLWAEYLEQTPPAWRGEIEHVGGKEATHFRDLREMSHWIQRCIEAQCHTGGKAADGCTRERDRF